MKNSIVSAVCQERRQTVERNVYPLDLSIENLHAFWERARKYKSIFNHPIRNDFNEFVSIFVHMTDNMIYTDSLFWAVDDFIGIYYLTDIRPRYDAFAHFTFFDGRLNGRVDLTKKMIKYIFEEYGFQRITVEIPKYATDPPRNFVKALGFTPEGRKRKAAFYENDWYDVNVYGILRSDVLVEG